MTVSHAGDTSVFGDRKPIGEIYKPDRGCLTFGDVFTTGPWEASYAVRLLGVKHVIPMHSATFPMLTGNLGALHSEAEGIAGLDMHALNPGESLSAKS